MSGTHSRGKRAKVVTPLDRTLLEKQQWSNLHALVLNDAQLKNPKVTRLLISEIDSRLSEANSKTLKARFEVIKRYVNGSHPDKGLIEEANLLLTELVRELASQNRLEPVIHTLATGAIILGTVASAASHFLLRERNSETRTEGRDDTRSDLLVGGASAVVLGSAIGLGGYYFIRGKAHETSVAKAIDTFRKGAQSLIKKAQEQRDSGSRVGMSPALAYDTTQGSNTYGSLKHDLMQISQGLRNTPRGSQSNIPALQKDIENALVILEQGEDFTREDLNSLDHTLDCVSRLVNSDNDLLGQVLSAQSDVQAILAERPNTPASSASSSSTSSVSFKA